MSTKQSGHEQNVVNLGVMIHRIKSFRPGYDPSRDEFTVENLESLKGNGETVIDSWNLAENVFKKSVSARGQGFTDFDSMTTRSINALRISGASAQIVEQAEAIVRNLRGERASDKLTEAEIAEAKENGEEIKNNTVHNSTIDSKVENLKKYIQFISIEEKYNPNEADLKIDTLNNKLLSLKTVNDSYSASDAALNAARMARNTVLYTNNTGLVDICLGVKLYVKSAFGATSPEYKAISDLKFRKIITIPDQIVQPIQER